MNAVWKRHLVLINVPTEYSHSQPRDNVLDMNIRRYHRDF